MLKHMRWLLLFAVITFISKAPPARATANSTVPANGVLINETGTAGACVAVTTASAVTVLHGDPNAVTSAVYATTAMNCYEGTVADGAPATTPTTGAIGTGVGWPLPATTWVSISPGRTLVIGQGSNATALNLLPGDRLDCIAASSNGAVCSFRTY